MGAPLREIMASAGRQLQDIEWRNFVIVHSKPRKVTSRRALRKPAALMAVSGNVGGTKCRGPTEILIFCPRP